jgi:hypothetical protein
MCARTAPNDARTATHRQPAQPAGPECAVDVRVRHDRHRRCHPARGRRFDRQGHYAASSPPTSPACRRCRWTTGSSARPPTATTAPPAPPRPHPPPHPRRFGITIDVGATFPRPPRRPLDTRRRPPQPATRPHRPGRSSRRHSGLGCDARRRHPRRRARPQGHPRRRCTPTRTPAVPVGVSGSSAACWSASFIFIGTSGSSVPAYPHRRTPGSAAGRPGGP